VAPLWTMGWLAVEYLDGPMARHLYPFRQVRRAVQERLPLCMGFGAAVYLMLWIPVLNFFFIPVAVVGGTLLFRGLRACGSLPEPGK
jgi:CysZ protein